MTHPPTRGRRDSVEVLDEGDRIGRDLSQLLHAAQQRVVEVDPNFARVLEAVGAASLEPVRSQCFDRVVYGIEVLTRDLLLRQNRTIAFAIWLLRVVQR